METPQLPPLYNLWFSGMTPTEILHLADGIEVALKNHPFYTTPPPHAPPLDGLSEAKGRLRENLQQISAGNRTRIPFRDAAHVDTVKYVTRIGLYLQLAAGDDYDVLQNCGYPFVKPRTRSSAPPPPLTAVPHLEVVNGAEPGVVYAAITRQPGATGTEIYITDGDPTVEENWRHFASYGSFKDIPMSGLESAKKCSFRARLLGKTDRGPWSAVVTLIVT